VLIIMKKSADEGALDHVKEFLINRNFDIHQSTGVNRIIIGVIGDTDTLDTGEIEKMPGVLQVIRITKEEGLKNRFIHRGHRIHREDPKTNSFMILLVFDFLCVLCALCGKSLLISPFSPPPPPGSHISSRKCARS